MRTVTNTLLIFSILLAAFLRFNQLAELMPFIGDQAWYYIAARDMIVNGDIPLVGITASRTWLHQGPYWTYMIAPVMYVLKFHPVAPAVVGATSGLLATILMYIVVRKMFGSLAGSISAMLYASSPLIILNERMAFQLSPVPLVMLGFIYAMFMWTQAKKDQGRYAFLTVVMLIILYNINLASVIVWPVVGLYVLYGYFRKRPWFIESLKPIWIKRTALMSLILLLPVILYDIGHGFPQTLKFAAWYVSRPIMMFVKASSTSDAMLPYLQENITRILFMPSSTVAFALIIGSAVYLLYKGYTEFARDTFENPYVFLGIAMGLSFVQVVVNKTASFAYFVTLFPLIIMMVGIMCAYVIEKNRLLVFGILMIVLINASSLISSSYLVNIPGGFGPSMLQHRKVATHIVNTAQERPYTIVGKGRGSQFESFTMNTEYLTWWLGHPPVEDPEDAVVTFEVRREDEKLFVREL